jgi:N4-gp56 family major capsid protein
VKANLTWGMDIQMRPLPKGNGRKVQFRRMVPFKPSTRPLEEGVTKKGQNLRQTDMWITMKPYGEHVEYTDELDLYNIDNMHREINELLSRQARESINILARDAKCAGTNVMYAGGRASRAALTASDKLTYDLVRKAVRTLEKNLAPKFSDGYYHANIDPDTKYDLMQDPMWIDPAKYQDKSMIAKNEIGILAGVKFFETTIGKTYENEDDYLVYASSTATTGLTELTVHGYDATTKTVYVKEALNEYEARSLGARLVKIGNEPAFIEWAKAGAANAGELHLRWALATAPTADTTKITQEEEGPSGVNIRATVIYGQDFCGGISLDGTGHNVRVIIKPLGSSGSDDPYDQRGTIAYKIKGVGYHILQDAFGVRIEHAVSA